MEREKMIYETECIKRRGLGSQSHWSNNVVKAIGLIILILALIISIKLIILG
jgi:hypothetical protein